MMLNSLALRGRSLFTISSTATLPSSLRPLASHAINSAHQVLVIVLEEPSIRDSMVGVPLYLHTVIAFAVVFLIKMSSRWAGIGVSIDPAQKTKPLIENVIALFRSCQAGQAHVLYAMADGFERLLRRNLGGNAPGLANVGNGYVRPNILTEGYPDRRPSGEMTSPYTQHAHSISQQPPPHQPLTDMYNAGMSTLLPPQHTANSPNSYTPGSNPRSTSHPNAGGGSGAGNFDSYLSPPSQSTSVGTFGGWQTEDDMLWSMGMGYDLLATAPDVNAHGFFGWPGSGSGDGAGLGYSGF